MSTVARFALNDGATIPWLGFGTGTALYHQNALAAVKTAIASGIDHLDGAQAYQNEDSLGAGVAASGVPREALFITTKLNTLTPGHTVKQMLQESLRKLKTSYVDLFLIHSPTPHEGRLKEVWRELEEIKRESLAKSIGVSNFKVEHLKEILDGATIKPAVNQIEYHPYVFKAAQPILEFAKQHGIVIESYGGLSPIIRSPGGPLGPVLETIRKRLEGSAGQPVTAGQVLTKWMYQKGIVVVTTTSKVSRIHETLAVPSLPRLTEEEIKVIETTGSTYHKRHFGHAIFGDD